MISKMKFVNITGPKADIDRVVSQYLSVYPIHLENALAELNTADRLTPFTEANPYKETALALEEIAKVVNKGDLNVRGEKDVSLGDAVSLIERLDAQSTSLGQKKEDLEKTSSHYKEILTKIEPFKSADFDLEQVLRFKFIKYRFGKIALTYFDRFSKYVYEQLNTIFCECHRDEQYVWGVYFAPQSVFVKVDAVFASMHFERIFIPDEYEGTPVEVYHKLTDKINAADKLIEDCNYQLSNIYNHSKQDINNAYSSIFQKYMNFDIRKKAACTKERSQIFYILCGWMEEKTAGDFARTIEGDDRVFIIIEDEHDSTASKPPTKLKNAGVFKPFQMFVGMYGLPAHNEIDPTKFVALTYALMFGIMFGDIGQGACLVIGGYLLYRYKNMAIAGIISFCGLFSVFFGFMYGSIFGFETVLKPLWLKPMESENMMTVLILAVAFGVILILAAMIIHFINAVKQKNPGEIIFGPNGIAGLLLYITVIYIVLAKLLPAVGPAKFIGILTALIVICLIGIAFNEPLKALVNRQKFQFHESKKMFVLQSVFELFEVALSYMTNTISFIRVGAFALSHAGMMSVVLMLSGIETGGSLISPVIIVLGNILIAGLEGLIVGIQVLRLEYYEIFSRFYSGTGREFKPYKPQINRSADADL